MASAPTATPTAAPPVAAAAPVPVAAAVTPHLPDRLSDEDFWKLTSSLSEPGGSFRSDNLLSNEVWLQHIIPDLLAAVKPDRVYLGVGPEQNFTYIAALHPAMAFIIDIRRGNLDLHLMYKAIFDLAADRPDFVALLLSRTRPPGLTAASSPEQIFQAFAASEPDQALFERNFAAIVNDLKVTHHFALQDDDVPGIRYVYEYFAKYGQDLTYWMTGGMGGGRGFGGRNSPTYADLMTAQDGSGTNRSYLATEDNFRTLKTLEAKNLIVPVVGNFAGPTAIRATGDWIRSRGGMVSSFYLSNVEQYLNMDGIWMTFCQNAATLPIDETSQFIRSYRNANGPGFGGGSLDSGIFPMKSDLRACAAQ